MKRQFALRSAGVSALLLFLAGGVCAGVTIDGAGKLSVTVGEGGDYQVNAQVPGWSFQGRIGQPLSNIQVGQGSDEVGPYAEIGFDWTAEGARHGSIRAYTNQPVVLFTVTYQDASGNSAPFPMFSGYPANLRHVTYSGMFAMASFYAYAKDSPWLFFDSAAHAFLLSAASDFQVTETSWGPNHEMVTGFSPKIAALPAGTSHRTILVVENGINAAFETWGNALTSLY
ncbi:MAG TPA: hypothetical protein VG672_06270, partial [Bryobacteraceae bacterium]|nr:hypothetical protein [Bryobacteraceae bacterium]